jgi:hypothetical protein
LDLRDAEHLLIRDEPRSFAEACVSLMTDTELSKRLSANGKSVLMEQYSQQVVNIVVSKLVKSVT